MGKLIDADALKKKFAAQRDKIEKERKYGWEFVANGFDGAIFLTGVEAAKNGVGWIPCSERLPDKGEVVLITNDKGHVRSGQYRGFNYGKNEQWTWKGNRIERVLAWQPMPEPYRGEQQ